MPDQILATYPESVVITLTNDRDNKQTLVEATPDLARLIGFAHHWRKLEAPNDQFTLRFSSMLAALVAGPGFLSEWLRGHLALRGVADHVVTNGRAFQDSPLPAQPLFTTYSFRQALGMASQLANKRTLDVRHFMAAYPAIKEYHREDFLRFRIDRRAWCLGLAQILEERFPDEMQLWREYGASAPAVLLPAFDADLPRGADLLGVGREVEAFAMLIAGRDTLTPLSVGVFGAWGSGKSYFMERVEERVAALSAEAPEFYYQKIAQVRFNAWHYAESNVVASLVDHIFRNLRFDPDEEEPILIERQKRALAELGAAEDVRKKHEDALIEARAEEQRLEESLARIASEIDQKVREKRQELARAGQALVAAQERLRQSVQDQADAIERARNAAPAHEAVAFMTRTILQDDDLKKLESDLKRASEEARWVGLNQGTILWGVVVLGLTAIALATADFLSNSKAVVGLLGLMSALGPVALKWRKVLGELAAKGSEYKEAVRQRAEAVVKKIEEAGQAMRAELEAAVEARRTEIATLQSEMTDLASKTKVAELALAENEDRRNEAVTRHAAAAAEVEKKRTALASITSGSLLEEIVRDLASSDVYSKELGMLARARTDFERLSRRMKKAREDFEADPSLPEPVLDRIVLYIDDLDRCPEDKVREVLRAVHLLLAFDLFVCVVAVDPRWVIQCLARSPGLVIGEGKLDPDLEVLGGAATPSDYLEKIFQIPLWLRPVPADQRAALIGTLLGKHLDREETARRLWARLEDAATAEGTGSLGRRRSASPEDSPPQAVRAPEKIRITPAELAFLNRVAPLLDGNARALKRFVNTYRLLKAGISDVELEYFAKEIPYRICITQLAVLATQRRRARLLVRLADASSARTLKEWLDGLAAQEAADVKSLAADLRGALLPELEAIYFDRFALWLERTRRYSFYL